MTNRSDESAPGVQVMAAPMMHSMDFHSAMVSPQDKYLSVAPGQTISFEFTANYPGVYMYHCGTPMVLEHIASGMYGMMVLRPVPYELRLHHRYFRLRSMPRRSWKPPYPAFARRSAIRALN
jgi:Multicopper oxidase